MLADGDRLRVAQVAQEGRPVGRRVVFARGGDEDLGGGKGRLGDHHEDARRRAHLGGFLFVFPLGLFLLTVRLADFFRDFYDLKELSVGCGCDCGRGRGRGWCWTRSGRRFICADSPPSFPWAPRAEPCQLSRGLS